MARKHIIFTKTARNLACILSEIPKIVHDRWCYSPTLLQVYMDGQLEGVVCWDDLDRGQSGVFFG